MYLKFLLLSTLISAGVLAQLLNPILPSPAQPAYCGPNSPTQAPCAPSTLDGFKNAARGLHGNDDRSAGVFPSWINLNLALQGQQMAKNNLLSVILAFIFGIMGSQHPDAINLVNFARIGMTQSQSNNATDATLAQVFVWAESWLNYVNSSTYEDVVASIQRVRKVHIATAAAGDAQMAQAGYLIPPDFFSSYTLTSALNGPFFQDLLASNIPASMRSPPPSKWNNVSVVSMNQQVSGLTLFGFYGLLPMMPQSVALFASNSDIWAYNHLWAILGYAMGMQDQFNPALQPDLASQQQMSRQLFNTFTIPNWFNMDYNQIVGLEQLLITAQNLSYQIFSPNLLLCRYLKSVLQIPATNTCATMSAQDVATDLLLDGIYATPSPANSLTTLLGGLTTEGIFDLSGVQYFGPSYTNLSWRAHNAFFAKYGVN